MDTVASLLAAYRGGQRTPSDTVRATYRRIAEHADPALFITLRPEADVLAEAAALEAHHDAALPLYGIPVAVKDNIDVAGLPTTAACPAFAYDAQADAAAVARLKAAGALIIGKTNLDQFATGLVGVRSPYGIPRNVFKPELVPGGSSSGSASAVAAGIVPIALGTDTAGSGRVPAMLQNIVGLKPSLGLVPNLGLVPACRTLDCISIFALTVDDAMAALEVIGGFEPTDAFSRPHTVGALGPMPAAPTLGVLPEAQREFFGDADAAAAYAGALDRLKALGATLKEIDFSPFAETARLLYEGPWVAERWLAAETLMTTNPDAVHPVTRAITEGGAKPTAADAFRALYRLQELRAVVRPVLAGLDAIVVPTAPTAYGVEEVLADPIRLNSRLGTYTNFVNLLDLCGTAVPAAIAASGVPYGITFLAPAGQDAEVASLARAFAADTGLPMAASAERPAYPPLAPPADPDRYEICVFGAHMSGMPLNAELKSFGARFVTEVETAPVYRMSLVEGPRPGVVRVNEGGASLKGEIWSLPYEGVGRLVGAIVSPLGLGTVELSDGRTVTGFLCESAATHGCPDITAFGSFRSYVASVG